MWPFNLSVRLPIVAMVGRYPAIQLIGREAILQRISPLTPEPCGSVVLCGISSRFQLLSPSEGQVPHVLLTRSPLSYISVTPKGSVNITPFDLHVLGAPPAFVLSQDQTLYKMVSKPDYSEFKSFAQNAIACVLSNYSLEFLPRQLLKAALKVPFKLL